MGVGSIDAVHDGLEGGWSVAMVVWETGVYFLIGTKWKIRTCMHK